MKAMKKAKVGFLSALLALGVVAIPSTAAEAAITSGGTGTCSNYWMKDSGARTTLARDYCQYEYAYVLAIVNNEILGASASAHLGTAVATYARGTLYSQSYSFRP
jgi:hypothetical protein